MKKKPEASAREQAGVLLGELLHVSRLILETLKAGRIPKGETLLTIAGKPYRLTMTKNRTGLTIEPEDD